MMALGDQPTVWAQASFAGRAALVKGWSPLSATGSAPAPEPTRLGASSMEHAITVVHEPETGFTTLRCMCGETASGRCIDVLEMWAAWHLRTNQPVPEGSH